jgi:methyltransferase
MVATWPDTLSVPVAGTVLLVVLIGMLAELRVSRANEKAYRRRGAVDAPDPVYDVMRWAYPGAFVAMAVEGALSDAPLGWPTSVGVTLFIAAKALKVWAISSLGLRWTYRVLVLPGAPLVTAGPYRFLRHPNYVAVVGELIGMALTMHAAITGPVMTLFFLELLRRRVAAEERALGLATQDRGAASVDRR